MQAATGSPLSVPDVPLVPDEVPDVPDEAPDVPDDPPSPEELAPLVPLELALDVVDPSPVVLLEQAPYTRDMLPRAQAARTVRMGVEVVMRVSMGARNNESSPVLGRALNRGLPAN